MNNLRLGIVGAGFVGGSVIAGFDKNVDQFVVDPKHNKNTIKDLVSFDPPIVFVCVPTPESKDGDVDASFAKSVLKDLNNEKYSGIVVIKSTITPRHLTKFKKSYSNLRLVYNPEFLTEANAHEDFKNPQMQVLGGRWKDCELVEKAYVKHSSVRVCPTFKTDLITASMLKYTINSFLATKVTFFNELYELYQQSGASQSWEQFTDMLKRDTRIGDTHMSVPGPDGKFGFGGHCFPKDTKAFLHYAESEGIDLNLLQTAVEQNQKHRTKK